MHIIDGRISQIAGTRKRQAMQSGTHFAKTGGFRLHGPRLFHACWGAAPIPAEHKTCVLKRWIRPRGLRILRLAASSKAQSLHRSSSPHKATALRGTPSIGCAIFQIAYGRQLNAALPLFPVVHSLPPAPCPTPEYGRYWPWPSAPLSFPRGLFGSQRRLLSSPPAARRTRYSAP